MNTLFEIQQKTPPDDSSEWYTPPRYVDAARSVMGEIALDPASCELANQTVKAVRYYTKEQNGLTQDWTCSSLWLNPPYGRSAKMQGARKSTIGLFIEKLIREYEAGRVEQAIALVTTEVNAKWFYPLWQFPICFPDHRVHFLVPKKLHKYSQMFGTCFVYLGINEQTFIDVFSSFGRVAKVVDTPLLTPKPPQLWKREAVS
jgi:ParB family chromosome partitioning protein